MGISIRLRRGCSDEIRRETSSCNCAMALLSSPSNDFCMDHDSQPDVGLVEHLGIFKWLVNDQEWLGFNFLKVISTFKMMKDARVFACRFLPH